MYSERLRQDRLLFTSTTSLQIILAELFGTCACACVCECVRVNVCTCVRVYACGVMQTLTV